MRSKKLIIFSILCSLFIFTFSSNAYGLVSLPMSTVVSVVCQDIYTSVFDSKSAYDVAFELKNKEIQKQKEEEERQKQKEAEAAQAAYDEYMSSFENIGSFKITYYCPCGKCNGNTHRITASGNKLVPGISIAVDKRVIPLGSTVLINGKEYIAHDTGSAIKGNRIDICVSSHSEALQLGKTTATVYVRR